MDGFVNLLKPPGMTSSDAVVFLRRLLPKGVKTGHGGTLDPEAAGVLPICVGKATRLFDYFIDKEKEYIAEVCLGIETDTQDATGHVVARRPGAPTAEQIEAALPALTGAILQTPPAYSALKRQGKRLYQLARAGQAVQVEPRQVFVQSLDYLGPSGYNRHMLRVVCRKGVYVRTLMRDLGEMLGCGGHMSFLLRARAGCFALDGAITLEELARPGALEGALYPLDAPLAHLPQARLAGRWRRPASHGNPVPAPDGLNPGELVRVYVEDDFAGIAQAGEDGLLRFKAMLL